VTIVTRNSSFILAVVTMHFNINGYIVSVYSIILTDGKEKYVIGRGLCRVAITVLAIAIQYLCVSICKNILTAH
jgi:hypothetical protein